MSALVTLPLICFIGLFIIGNKSELFKGYTALIGSGNLLLLFVCLETEVLSSLHELNYTWIVSFWITITLLISFNTYKSFSWRSFNFLKEGPIWLKLITAFVLISTLTVALVAPSNTWDGMSYHMSRVIHWINNQSISYYPTPIGRQNYMPPLCEEAILQLQVLSQSDHFSNIVSWFYYSLSLICLGAITAELKLNRTYQWLSAVLGSLIPMAIFQATGCKNDTTLTFLFLSFVYFLLKISSQPTLSLSILAGISLGLGLYCKTTFLILGGSFGIWFCFLHSLNSQTTQARLNLIKSLAIVLVIGTVISSPYWIREAKTGFEGVHAEASLQNNEDKTPLGITANLVRSMAIELTLPVPAWNGSLYKCVTTLLGSHLNDPKTTYPGYQYLAYYWPHEDHMGNFIPFILIFISLIILTFKFKNLTNNHRLLYLSPLTAVIIFAILLKWQPWINRLYTPLFFLSTPLISLGLNEISLTYKSFNLKLCTQIAVLTCLVFAIPALFINSSRPIISLNSQGIFQVDRITQYFANRPELKSDYLTIDAILKKSHLENTSVGLLLGPDDWEYPFLVLSGAVCGNAHAAYHVHTIEPNKPERVIVALGSMATALSKNTNLRVIYQGPYGGLYEAK